MRGAYNRGRRLDESFLRTLVELLENCTLEEFIRRDNGFDGTGVDRSEWSKLLKRRQDPTNRPLTLLSQRWGVRPQALFEDASPTERTWASEGELVRQVRSASLATADSNRLFWRGGQRKLEAMRAELVRNVRLLKAVARLVSVGPRDLGAAATLAVESYNSVLVFDLPDRENTLRELWPLADGLVHRLPVGDHATHRLLARHVRNTPGPGDRDRFGDHILDRTALILNLYCFQRARDEIELANALGLPHLRDYYGVGEQIRSLAGRSIQGRSMPQATEYLHAAKEHWEGRERSDPTVRSHLYKTLAKYIEVFGVPHEAFPRIVKPTDALGRAVEILDVQHKKAPHHMTAWVKVAIHKSGGSLTPADREYVVESLRNCPVRYSSIVGDTQDALRLVAPSLVNE